MWLKHDTGLINLDNISSIDAKTGYDGIVVKVKLPTDPISVSLVTFSTREKAVKFLSKVSDYMNQGIKCIDVSVIVRQVENECQH